MTKPSDFGLTPIEILIKGRKSKAKPFKASAGREALRRMVDRVPEVMVKISGGGKTVQHVLKHLAYITRDGKLEAVDNENNKVSNKDDLAELMDAWGIDLTKGLGKNKLVFNIVLSMPTGTDPAKLFAAAQDFAKEQYFGEREYLMVLHEPETDPKSKKEDAHPHVHLVIKAEGYDGKRLHIRKATLEDWRESFAEKLRERGINANATRRDVRGLTKKSKKTPLFYLDKEKRPSYVRDSKLSEARDAIDNGYTPQVWDKALQERRTTINQAYEDVAKELEREGDGKFANAVRKFANELKPIETERQTTIAVLKRALNKLRQPDQIISRPKDREKEQSALNKNQQSTKKDAGRDDLER